MYTTLMIQLQLCLITYVMLLWICDLLLTSEQIICVVLYLQSKLYQYIMNSKYIDRYYNNRDAVQRYTIFLLYVHITFDDN